MSLALPKRPPDRQRSDDRLEYPTQRFQVAGKTIAAIVLRGAGRPVIFLHGNSSTKAVWKHQIDLMRRHGRAVLAPDLPGHGESENSRTPEATYSFPGYAAVIRTLIDKLGWPAVDIVGWSLGGHIGLELLATDLRVHSLLIVGTPPARPCAEALSQVFHASDCMQLAGRDQFNEADAVTYGSAMMGGREHLTPDLLANIRRTDGNARRCMFASALAGVGTDQRKSVETIDRPLCVVHGEQEPFVRLDYLRSLKYRRLWNDHVQVIPDAGHAPHWQCPAAFNSILTGFMELSQSQAAADYPVANLS